MLSNSLDNDKLSCPLQLKGGIPHPLSPQLLFHTPKLWIVYNRGTSHPISAQQQ